VHWLFDGADGEVFRHPASIPPSVNVAEALAEAIREGVGIGPLPVPVVLGGLRGNTLVRVLPQHRLRATNVFAFYASRRYLDAKIRTFVEFLRNAVPPAIAERECEVAHLGTASHPRLPALR
jgi:DNA-binding transcriptional LysR family regulator